LWTQTRPADLAFDTAGKRLFQSGPDGIREFNPDTLQSLGVVVPNVVTAGIRVDPVSGNVFYCGGPGGSNPFLGRFTPPTVPGTQVASTRVVNISSCDGVTIASNGTFYISSDTLNQVF